MSCDRNGLSVDMKPADESRVGVVPDDHGLLLIRPVLELLHTIIQCHRKNNLSIRGSGIMISNLLRL